MSELQQEVILNLSKTIVGMRCTIRQDRKTIKSLSKELQEAKHLASFTQAFHTVEIRRLHKLIKELEAKCE